MVHVDAYNLIFPFPCLVITGKCSDTNHNIRISGLYILIVLGTCYFWILMRVSGIELCSK